MTKTEQEYEQYFADINDSSKLEFDQDSIAIKTPDNLNVILEERGSRYGKFSDVAELIQSFKLVAHNSKNWETMESYQKEAIDMILHKVGRILNGDPSYQDSWVDIGGYAELVVKELKGEGI